MQPCCAPCTGFVLVPLHTSFLDRSAKFLHSRPSWRFYLDTLDTAGRSSTRCEIAAGSEAAMTQATERKPLKAKLHHCSLITSDTERSAKFYVGLLGFEVLDSRPKNLSHGGIWFGTGAFQIHLIEMPNVDPVEGRPAYVGHDRHTAFVIPDLAALTEILDREKIPYSGSSSGRKVAFFR
mmetsp:Transcript_43883/g.71348  ORF Transcript_43883/g.71348 Transcript_43883/m.71348 type:complete len:180 (+) Transcript_43883:861-1400(+)